MNYRIKTEILVKQLMMLRNKFYKSNLDSFKNLTMEKDWIKLFTKMIISEKKCLIN